MSTKTTIYTDHNGVSVDASTECPGHQYVINSGDTLFAAIQFHAGPVKDGLNGITNEHLLAILINRTEYLDSKFPSDYNKEAICGMKYALARFEARTKERVSRGVAGKNIL